MNTPRTLPTATLSLHPEAALVPEMPPDQYEPFLADVKVRGVLKPIEVIPGTKTVIEGRTRLKAATDAGLPSVPVVDADIAAGDTPVMYMLRAALLRRHLTSGQAAALAVEIEEQLAKAAKERQREGGAKGGEAAGRGRPKKDDTPSAPAPVPIVDRVLGTLPQFPADAAEQLAAKGVLTVADLDAKVADLQAKKRPGATANRYEALEHLGLPYDLKLAAGDAVVDVEIVVAKQREVEFVPQTKPKPAKAQKSRDQAAAIAGTNPRYVSDAKKVKAAAPEVFDKLKAGAVSLPEAKRAAKVDTPAKPKAADAPLAKPKDEPPAKGAAALQPCPFCGSANVGIKRGEDAPYVRCKDCQACGPMADEGGEVRARIVWNERAKK